MCGRSFWSIPGTMHWRCRPNTLWCSSRSRSSKHGYSTSRLTIRSVCGRQLRTASNHYQKIGYFCSWYHPNREFLSLTGSLSIMVQYHHRQRNSQRHRLNWTNKNTSIAVPAFFRIHYFCSFSIISLMKNITLACLITLSTTDTLFLVNDWWHISSLYFLVNESLTTFSYMFIKEIKEGFDFPIFKQPDNFLMLMCDNFGHFQVCSFPQ